MTPDLLWFVLAGFLLGFITSTLWEWFYFRRERLKLTDRRIRELESKLQRQQDVAVAPAEEDGEPAWAERSYRSPGVFLDTEDRGEEAQDDETAEPLPTVNRIAAGDAAVANSARRGESDAPDEARKPLAARPMSARTRQEVLAALRRNSEAAQRSLGAEVAEPAHSHGQEDAAHDNGAQHDTTHHAVVEHEPVDLASDSDTVTVSPGAPTTLRTWQQDPKLTQPSPDYPDNLSRIKGIGDVYRYRLYHAGIYTWHQVATADEETLRRATSAYPSSNVHEWPPQAQQLAEKNGRTGAVYTGPTPDDLTKILGIGPVSAQSLYRAGICTYEQLASTRPERLAELFPIAVAGDQPDFDAWIVRATRLADEKHSS